MSISCIDFFHLLVKNDVEFFAGVPDSLLKEFCLCIDDNLPPKNNIIAANEGNAVAIAAGYHLATGRLPMVYMQNSGLGNAINPLLSLCDTDVYSVPMLLLIGWRGEPGIYDEPQHVKQGKVQLDLLQVMDIPYEIISKNEQQVDKKIVQSAERALKENRPCAIVVKKGTFNVYGSTSQTFDEGLMTREESLEIILERLPNNSIIVSTTGKTSREIFEIRERNNRPHFSDFLTVGSMGHCSSIALGIAIAKPDRKIVCVDGDGALIMHLGNLSTVGKLNPKNFYHVLINNYVHDSVGGQETSAKFIDIPKMVEANGYKYVFSAQNFSQLKNQFEDFLVSKGPAFLEIQVKPGSRKDLGRPQKSPLENKKSFMQYLKNKGIKTV